LFALAALSFFRKRIPFEETALCRMFPGEYAAYAAGTKTWIPGVP
jgi:protein-S-isoprenylcysteine O-methyltransferase Ste14